MKHNGNKENEKTESPKRTSTTVFNRNARKIYVKAKQCTKKQRKRSLRSDKKSGTATSNSKKVTALQEFPHNVREDPR